jgi:chromate reductase
MDRTSIAVIVGSLRKDSFNRRLAHALARLAPAQAEFVHLRIDDLPLYNQDDDDRPAPAVKRLKSEVRAAHGLLFVTPEYNRSVPGVLKNAIDHASRPYGQNAFKDKPAGVIGISVGQIGTAVAQHDLRGILAYLEVPTFAQPEAYLTAREGFFDAEGGIGKDHREFLQKWMDRYIEFVRAHAKAAEERQARRAA